MFVRRGAEVLVVKRSPARGGYWHSIAGGVEPGETELEAALRELREETGYVAEEWIPLGGFTNDGNRGCGIGHLFLARRARQVAEPDAGDLEEMQIRLMGLDEVLAAVRRGDVAVLSAAAAIGLAVAAQSAGCVTVHI